MWKQALITLLAILIVVGCLGHAESVSDDYMAMQRVTADTAPTSIEGNSR